MRLEPLARRTHSPVDDALVSAVGRTHAGLVLPVSLYKKIASRRIEFAHPSRTIKIDMPAPAIPRQAIDVAHEAQPSRRSPRVNLKRA